MKVSRTTGSGADVDVETDRSESFAISVVETISSCTTRH
jgi:hypothetical protein